MPKLALNKKARFDYEFLDTFEGGLGLTGAEVKSIKEGHVQLKGAFVSIRDSELWLRNSYVAPYKPAGKQSDYDPSRDRKILVHRAELKRLIGKTQEAGLTIVPISLYTKGRLVKLEFALARGKKKYEKRATIKKRELDRKVREHLRE
jgi:SsrA-binding protein